MSEEERKIIIDEDWKTRVQREKEEARAKGVGEAEESKPTPERASAEASFSSLTSSLAAQALFALGLIASRDTQEVTVDLDQARFLIDTLMMMREKTKGNLLPEEQGHLTEVIAELQRAFAARAQQVQEAALRNAGANPQGAKKR